METTSKQFASLAGRRTFWKRGLWLWGLATLYSWLASSLQNCRYLLADFCMLYDGEVCDPSPDITWLDRLLHQQLQFSSVATQNQVNLLAVVAALGFTVVHNKTESSSRVVWLCRGLMWMNIWPTFQLVRVQMCTSVTSHELLKRVVVSRWNVVYSSLFKAVVIVRMKSLSS